MGRTVTGSVTDDNPAAWQKIASIVEVIQSRPGALAILPPLGRGRQARETALKSLRK